MKRNTQRAAALLLALALLLTGCAGAREKISSAASAVAEKREGAKSETAAQTAAPARDDTADLKQFSEKSEETVYVLTDEAGKTDRVIVSAEMQDVLAKAEGDGRSKVYDADGTAVTYRGDIDSELP